MIQHQTIEVLGTDDRLRIHHLLTPLHERAARFLNTFVGRTITMTEKEFESVRLEMSAHGCWLIDEEVDGQPKIGLLNNTMPQFMNKLYAALLKS
jgi:hypothetical protein